MLKCDTPTNTRGGTVTSPERSARQPGSLQSGTATKASENELLPEVRGKNLVTVNQIAQLTRLKGMEAASTGELIARSAVVAANAARCPIGKAGGHEYESEDLRGQAPPGSGRAEVNQGGDPHGGPLYARS